MNLLSGCAGFLCGAVISVPTVFLSGAVGQKIAKFAKETDGTQQASNGIGGTIGGLAVISCMNSSPFYTGAKVSIAIASILYTSAHSMTAVTVNVQKKKIDIVETGTFSSKSIK